MLTSKFRVSFQPNNLGDAVPRSQELVLDLGLRSRAAGASIESEAAVTEDCLHAECPDTVGDARASTGRGLCLECTAAALDAIPDQDPATSSGRGSFNSDQKNRYQLQWQDIDTFEKWRRSEECACYVSTGRQPDLGGALSDCHLLSCVGVSPRVFSQCLIRDGTLQHVSSETATLQPVRSCKQVQQ